MKTKINTNVATGMIIVSILSFLFHPFSNLIFPGSAGYFAGGFVVLFFGGLIYLIATGPDIFLERTAED